jgi:chemotaxis protein CheZ
MDEQQISPEEAAMVAAMEAEMAKSAEAEMAAAMEAEMARSAEAEMAAAMQEQMGSSGGAPEGDDPSKAMFNRVGNITRQLHDALKELGLAERLQEAAAELPDAQSRLNYIAKLTGEAAEKVLSSVDKAKAKQEEIISISRTLTGLFPAKPALAEQLDRLKVCGEETDQHLTDIMMAQDFHDLTGQVVQRVLKLSSTIEEQLVKLLVDVAPLAAASAAANAGHQLQGPVVNPEGRSDVATSQQDVDDLLASLGF